MSLMVACGWTLLRSLSIALLALPLCHGLALFLACRQGTVRRLAWGLLLAPFLMPELITGYGYSNFSLSLVQHPQWKELLYAALVAMRVVPVGTAAIYFAPVSPFSREAWHCLHLSFRPSEGRVRRWRCMIGFWRHGPLRQLLPAFLVMFLFTFQEFEIASLMWATSWTDWLFTAQVGGLSLTESLRKMLLPLACEVMVLGPGLWVLWRASSLPSAPESPRRRLSTGRTVAAWGYLLPAVAVVCLVPFVLIGRDLGDGIRLLGNNRLLAQGLLRNIAAGGGCALAAGLLASLLAVGLLRPGRWRRGRGAFAMVLSVGGLLGSLVLGLIILAVFQRFGLHRFRETPIPLLIGLVLFLLPRVLLLQVVHDRLRPRESLHLARLLTHSPSARQQARGRAMVWHLRYRGRVAVGALACYWAYLDLTLASLLRPVWMTTAPVELYNLMHYSRNDVLSAMTLVMIAAPLLLVLLAVAVKPLVLRLTIR